VKRKHSGEFRLDPPNGPIRYKYVDFVTNDDFPEIGFVGPQNTAKCVVDGTLVRTRRGLVPVEAVLVGDEVATTGGWKRVEAVHENGEQATVIVEALHGRRLGCTPEHKLLTRQGWREAGTLGPGDRLQVLLGEDRGESFDPWTYFLGLYSGDGNRDLRSSGKVASYVIITNMEPEIDDFFRDFLEPAGFSVTRREKDSTEALRYTIAYERRGDRTTAGAVQWLRDIMAEWGEGFGLAHEKLVPEKVLASSADSRRSYLQGLFDTDGYVGKRQGDVGLTLASRRMIEQVQVMLLDFGIVATVAHTANDHQGAWRLMVGGVHAEAFGDRIGFRVQRKQQRIRPAGRRANSSVRVVRGRLDAPVIQVVPGPVARTFDITVEGLHEYVAEGLVVHNSTAAVDRLARRAAEYPGSNILIARATLTSLKDSTIDKLRKRIGVLFESENMQEAIFRMPPEMHPVTGQPVQSVISGIGLDRVDLEHVLKSTEFATVHLEEANEIPGDAQDMVQERCRQEIWHRRLLVRDMCMDLAIKWSQWGDRTLTWQDVYHILLDDPLNRVGERQLASDHPMPGWTTVSATWNPEGNEQTWVRYVGVPYPYPAPTEQWVQDHVGIREVHVKPEVLRQDRFRFRAGAFVTLPGGDRRYVAKHDAATGVVTLTDGSERHHDELGLVLQRYCLYAFGYENESRDHRAVENTYLMANTEMRLRHQHGYSNEREGRVLPNYIDEPVSQGGHVLPEVSRDRIARSGNLIVCGLDHGGDHPTAILFGMYLARARSVIIFDELVVSGESAYANAVTLKQKMIPGLEHVVGYDPAMNARIFDRDSEHRIVDNYIEVLGDILFPGARGPDAFDELKAMLDVQDDFIGAGPMPRMMVTENCHQTRKTGLNLSWRMVSHQRGNWMVDVGDAWKILASIVRKGIADMPTIDVSDFQPRRAYSTRFKGAHS
jgi:hypothetical protein